MRKLKQTNEVALVGGRASHRTDVPPGPRELGRCRKIGWQRESPRAHAGGASEGRRRWRKPRRKHCDARQDGECVRVPPEMMESEEECDVPSPRPAAPPLVPSGEVCCAHLLYF